MDISQSHLDQDLPPQPHLPTPLNLYGHMTVTPRSYFLPLPFVFLLSLHPPPPHPPILVLPWIFVWVKLSVKHLPMGHKGWLNSIIYVVLLLCVCVFWYNVWQVPPVVITTTKIMLLEMHSGSFQPCLSFPLPPPPSISTITIPGGSL